MPKSRFNAVRERARARRHNPVEGRKAASNGQASGEVTLPTASAPTKEEDVLPILKSLPLDSSTKVELSEVLWALTSVTDFLSDKTSRTQVLMPQHKLIGRVLLQLNSQNDYQIRDAASGCLRNMCIEAGGKTCKALEDQGCVEKCIEEIKVAALRLGLTGERIPEANGKGEEQKKKEQAAQLLKKPKDGLNRKERRHLAKLEEAAAKRNGHKETDAIMSDAIISSNDLEQLGLADKDVDEEQMALCCSHLTNLIAILWCLVESSPKAVDLCRRSAHTLSKIIASIVSKTRESFISLRDSSYEFENGALQVHEGNKDKIRLDMAMIQLATTALNCLVTLTDSDQEISAAVVGVSKERLRHTLKSSKKALVIDDDGADTSDMEKDGVSNIQALIRAVLTMQLLYFEEDGGSRVEALQRQAVSLALLSLATIRNIQSSLPDTLRDSLHFSSPEQDEEEAQIWSKGEGNDNFTLGEFEMEDGLQSLTQIISNLRSEEIDSLDSVFDTLREVNSSSFTSSKAEAEKKSEEDVSNVSLALEIVAELAGDRKAWYGQSGKSKEEKDDAIDLDQDESEDDEMDEDDEGEEDDESDISLDMPEEGEVETDDGSPDGLSYISSFFPNFTYHMLEICTDTRDGFSMPKGEDGSEFNEQVAASLRSICIRALSALNNICLVLASYAQVPPSQPQRTDSEVKKFYKALQATNGRLGEAWKAAFKHANLVAALPCLAQSDNDQSSMSQDAKKVIELCLCIMWSTSRCYEGVKEQTSVKALPLKPSLYLDKFHFRYSKETNTAQNNAEVIPSLITAYKTSKKASSASVAAAQKGTTTFQLAPTPDGIRTHSLGVLSTLVRQPFVSLEDKERIITLLADVLDVLPTATDLTSRLNSAGISDTTSMDAMVVAVNGVIDTFANEESQWDHLYGKLRLQSRLKRASFDVKSSARTIDKRKQPALRAAADEAWSNLVAFVQYRDSLAK